MNGKKLKEVVWNPNALDAVRKFPASVQKELGDLILWLQLGGTLEMPHSRPMPGVGRGCRELRVRGGGRYLQGILFFENKGQNSDFSCIPKKSQKTPKREMENGKKKLKEMIDEEK